MKDRRVIIIDVVGLRPEHLEMKESTPHLNKLMAQSQIFKLKPVFPALTLPVQASMTTGLPPSEHGVVANGFYARERFEVSFWEQAASLVQGERIWDRMKKRNPEFKTAVLFWQNILYSGAEVAITPRPLHTDDGMIQWCYSKPVGLYEDICTAIGEFNLMSYWGPMAGIESSRWIAKASVEVMKRTKPNLMFIYLPHLDYCSQKVGPEALSIKDELTLIDNEVGRILQGIQETDMPGEPVVMVLSEYAFSPVRGDVPLNRIFRQNNLLGVRTIKGREYVDLELSPAFAMVDHQVAHIYVKSGYESVTRKTLEKTAGVDMVLGNREKAHFMVHHPRAGDLIAISDRDKWFSYYWWEEKAKEPDFATHVDIHRKPGYDPLELFLEPGSFSVSQDTSLIRGSHGRPPMEESDYVPLILNGADVEGKENGAVCNMTEIPKFIEKIFYG